MFISISCDIFYYCTPLLLCQKCVDFTSCHLHPKIVPEIQTTSLWLSIFRSQAFSGGFFSSRSHFVDSCFYHWLLTKVLCAAFSALHISHESHGLLRQRVDSACLLSSLWFVERNTRGKNLCCVSQSHPTRFFPQMQPVDTAVNALQMLSVLTFAFFD